MPQDALPDVRRAADVALPPTPWVVALGELIAACGQLEWTSRCLYERAVGLPANGGFTRKTPEDRHRKAQQMLADALRGMAGPEVPRLLADWHDYFTQVQAALVARGAVLRQAVFSLECPGGWTVVTDLTLAEIERHVHDARALCEGFHDLMARTEALLARKLEMPRWRARGAVTAAAPGVC